MREHRGNNRPLMTGLVERRGVRHLDVMTETVEHAPPGAVEPVIVAHDVQREEVVWYLAEHAEDFPGVDVRPAFKRRYKHGQAAAHVLGQVGAVTTTAVRTIPERRGSSLATVFGIAGLVVHALLRRAWLTPDELQPGTPERLSIPNTLARLLLPVAAPAGSGGR